MLFVVGALLALALLRWFPQFMAVMFCIAIFVVCFVIFYVVSFVA